MPPDHRNAILAVAGGGVVAATPDCCRRGSCRLPRPLLARLARTNSNRRLLLLGMKFCRFIRFFLWSRFCSCLIGFPLSSAKVPTSTARPGPPRDQRFQTRPKPDLLLTSLVLPTVLMKKRMMVVYIILGRKIKVRPLFNCKNNMRLPNHDHDLRQQEIANNICTTTEGISDSS